MKQFLRTPLFWLLFFGISAGAAIATYYIFPKAYPIVHLNITIDRSQAIELTKSLSKELSISIPDASYAASFSTDEHAKTFVELEAGGTQAFIQLMDNNLYQPYTWLVRQFKPFEQHQLFMRFTPEGKPYAFEEIVSEETDGTNINAQQAQELAHSFAIKAPWNIDFSSYKLIESSQETMPNGRIDHKFTFERTDTTIGEGFFQLQFTVTADRVTKLAHSIKVPDLFNRRYAQMRSANANIAYAASLLMLLLYVLGCGSIGLMVLFNNHWIVWKTAFYWGLLIAFLNAINIPNKLPLSWLNYATSLSPTGFLLQHAISMLYTFIFLSIALSLTFIAAESLTRKAFGHHLQFWHLFNKRHASTVTVLGYTISGYLLVPIVLCYTMIFTYFTMNRAGWWIPSSSLFNPDILATYFPWLESISLSLQAGFMEECLFRAVPLSSAALLGNKFGKRTWWISGAFILQAVIFGAAHANYPAQPSYARLVELLADSALFGGIFLWLGLLPAIIAHFIYDVFWFALPIFVASTTNALINKIIIIGLSVIPLAIVFGSRLRSGSWASITQEMYNRAWKPNIRTSIPQTKVETISVSLSRNGVISTGILGIIGIVLWITCSRFTPDSPTFSISRPSVEAKAIELLQERNISANDWQPLTGIFVSYEQNPDLNKQHRFVWQKKGNETYNATLGSYLTPAHWFTRFVKFNDTIEERAQEYQIYLNPDGSFLRFRHIIPETFAGAHLSKLEAIDIARAAAQAQFNSDPNSIRMLSAIETKQPQRLDWEVTFLDTQEQQVTPGQARILIKLSGNEVTDAYRTVHIPERWERAEENQLMYGQIIRQVCQLLIYLLVLLGAFSAISHWQSGSTISIHRMFLLLAIIFIFELFNSWPDILSKFNTSQPFYDQLFRSFSISSIMLLMRAAALAVMFGFVTYLPTKYRLTSKLYSLAGGMSLGIAFTGLQSLLITIIGSSGPIWPNFTPLRFAFPIIASIDSMILHYISLTIFLLLCILTINWATDYGTKRKMPSIGLCAIVGFIGSGLLYTNNLPLFFVAAITFSLLFALGYYMLLRFDRSMIIIATATYLILETVQELIFTGYPYAIFASIASILVLATISYIWNQRIE